MKLLPWSREGRAANKMNPFPIARDGKSHSPVPLLLGQEPGGNNNDLISIGGYGVMGFCPPDNDTIAFLLHNPEIEVWIDLLMGALPPVAFDISLGAVSTEVVFLVVRQILEKPLVILSPKLLICLVSGHRKRIKGVIPHAPLDAATRFLAVKSGHLLLVK